MKTFDFQQLIHAVSYFLSYQDKIGRSFMSNEATLRYPIADLLTSKRFQIDLIKLEHSHPQYFDRSIDLVIL